MSFLDLLLNRSVQKVLNQTAPSDDDEKGEKRKFQTDDSDDSPIKKVKHSHADSGTEDEHGVVKKKKKKKRLKEIELAEESSNTEKDASKKSKKDKKEKKGNTENTEKGDFVEKNRVRLSANGNVNDDENYYPVLKKKKKKDAEKNEIDSQAVETESMSHQKKKKDQEIFQHVSEVIGGQGKEQNVGIPSNERINRAPSTSKHDRLIADIYCPPNPEIITGELYNVVMYILNENISISMANAVWTHSCMPTDVKSKEKMLNLGVKMNKFTEEEDSFIHERIKFLKDNKVISNMKEFVTQLNNQNGNTHKHEKDKATRNIVGLFIGKDLPNRLAHEVTQRLIYLVTGTSLKNTYQYNLNEKRKQGMEFHIKQKHREWSLDEDEILIKNVLKDKFSSKFIPIKEVNDQDIDWVVVSENLVEYGRTPQLVRERWLRTVKVILMEGEDLDQDHDRHKYRKELLLHILNSGVTDRKEIRWKEVATHFYPKTSAMLSQDFWAMIKRKKQLTLADKISSAIEIFEDPNRSKIGRSNAKMKQKEDMKSRLVDFYRSLPIKSYT